MSTGQSSDADVVDNHCTECGEFESECICDSLDSKDTALRQILQLTDRPNSLADAIDSIRTIAAKALGEAP